MSTPLSTSHSADDSLPADLAHLANSIRAAAESKTGDCRALLELLRLLDQLHIEIRDTLFRDALPDNRQRLYRLLKDIERAGGWPYINRMHLRALLEHIELTDDGIGESATH